MKKVLLALAALGVVALPLAASAQSYYYPYQYDRHYDRDVVCLPTTQTIEEGQVAYFLAYGGDGDYDWQAEGRTYRDRGSSFSHRFDDEGTERVRVTSDRESDTCTVRVVERSHYYPPTYPTYPTYTPPVTVAATYVPKGLPNTGFPPVSSAALAFAVVLLFGVGLALTPYAKKIVTAIR